MRLITGRDKIATGGDERAPAPRIRRRRLVCSGLRGSGFLAGGGSGGAGGGGLDGRGPGLLLEDGVVAHALALALRAVAAGGVRFVALRKKGRQRRVWEG